MTDADDVTERARRLRQQALSDPDSVDLADIRAILSDPTAPPPAHVAALVALTNVARTRETVGASFVDDAATLLGRPSLPDAFALRCLRALAGNDPGAVLRVREAVLERVTLEDDDATQAATGCCAALVEADPAAFIDAVPTLAALLDAETDATRRNAMYVLTKVAEEYPEEVKPVVPQLLAGVTERDETHQTNALSALGAVTSAYPSVGVDVTDELADLAAEAPLPVRANAVGLLADVAKGHPDAVAPHAETLLAGLEADDEYLCGNAASAVLHVGVAHPERVREAVPALVDLLSHSSPAVRRNACRALGELGATAALEDLRELADGDPDGDVATVAAAAVDRIESGPSDA